MSCRRAALRLRGHSTRAAAPAAVPASPLNAAHTASSVVKRCSVVARSHDAHTSRSPLTRRALSTPRSLSTTAAAAAAAAAAAGGSSGDRSVVDVLRERGLLDACTNEDELRKAASEAGLAPPFTTLRDYFAVHVATSMVHVTNLTPASECNPSTASGTKIPADGSRYGPRNQSDTREWSDSPRRRAPSAPTAASIPPRTRCTSATCWVGRRGYMGWPIVHSLHVGLRS
jgi:hypothetical protein